MADLGQARIRALGRELARGLMHLVYPGACGICHRLLPSNELPFCGPCRSALTGDPYPTCPRCAVTVGPFVSLDGGCSHCRGFTFHFDRVLRLGPYEGLLREVILHLKRRAGEELAETLGLFWAEHAGPRFREIKADVVVPVPLHWWRRLTRGYDQSAALARGLAARLRLPCRPGLLRRCRNTPKQTLQTASNRPRNVHGAFLARAQSSPRNQTVLLVDDVMTTGSTANDAARALRGAGAGRVVVAVLARSQG